MRVGEIMRRVEADMSPCPGEVKMLFEYIRQLEATVDAEVYIPSGKKHKYASDWIAHDVEQKARREGWIDE